eukprot:SAG31_NODE_30555_length_379_cov_1.042857_1_plen_32_part_01
MLAWFAFVTYWNISFVAAVNMKKLTIFRQLLF